MELPSSQIAGIPVISYQQGELMLIRGHRDPDAIDILEHSAPYYHT